jgi:hypothetical protein
VRFLVVTAGLLVLAGTALGGRPTPHTLRKSPGGPIAAIAQNNGVAAWFTSGAKAKTCNRVHLMSPGQHDQSLPQPSPGSLTCNWSLADWPSQLAVASRIATALWTLHEGGPQPFDWVLAATVGGPERQVKRLAHASDGTGLWLGGVAGAGRTLAYSWNDVEYVDPAGCLSGGSCKQELAAGGIRLVTRTSVTMLPGAGPALQLAAAAGRIAYIPATIVKSGRPSPNTNSPLPILDAATGEVDAQAFVRGIPIAIALSSHVLAVLTASGDHDRISWFSTANGTRLGDVLVSPLAAAQLGASDRLIVYRVGRVLHDVSTRTGRTAKLANTALTSVGLSLAHGRLLWAENHNRTGRLRALAVG